MSNALIYVAYMIYDHSQLLHVQCCALFIACPAISDIRCMASDQLEMIDGLVHLTDAIGYECNQIRQHIISYDIALYASIHVMICPRMISHCMLVYEIVWYDMKLYERIYNSSHLVAPTWCCVCIQACV